MPHVYIVVQRIQCKPIVYAIYIIVYVRIKRIWQLLNSCLCISVHFENQGNVSKTIPNEYWLMVFSKNTWLYEQWLTYISGWIWFFAHYKRRHCICFYLIFFIKEEIFHLRYKCHLSETTTLRNVYE